MNGEVVELQGIPCMVQKLKMGGEVVELQLNGQVIGLVNVEVSELQGVPYMFQKLDMIALLEV